MKQNVPFPESRRDKRSLLQCLHGRTCQKGGEVCRRVHGKEVLLRGLLEYTNYCGSNCLYCGIRHDNTAVQRYRIEESMLLEAVRAGFDRGIRTFVVQGGEDSQYDNRRICRLVESIKAQTSGEAAVTLSCGMRSLEPVQKR